MDLVLSDETYAIRGAIFEVYKQMGCGFLEAVYQECLEIEFARQNIPYIAQPELSICYKDKVLKQCYKPDFICFDQIIIELKAVKNVTNEHSAQLLNYLTVCKFKVGLLVNFGSYPKVEIKRMVL